MMSQSMNDSLHMQIINQYHRKIKPIPTRVWPSGRKPTIVENLQNADTCYVSSFPRECQVHFIFKNFSTLEAFNFKARKHEQRMAITATIFLWQLDKNNSLSRHHTTIRLNMICALIATAEDDSSPAHELAPSRRFLSLFVEAFIDYNFRIGYDNVEGLTCNAVEDFIKEWKFGEFHFMYWGRNSAVHMKAAVANLASRIPQVSTNPADFYSRIEQDKSGKVKEKIPLWALEYVLSIERTSDEIDQKEKGFEAETFLENNLASSFSHLGMISNYMKDPNLAHNLLVSSPVSSDPAPMVTLVGDLGKMWIDPAKAISLVQNASSLVDAIGRLTL